MASEEPLRDVLCQCSPGERGLIWGDDFVMRMLSRELG